LLSIEFANKHSFPLYQVFEETGPLADELHAVSFGEQVTSKKNAALVWV